MHFISRNLSIDPRVISAVEGRAIAPTMQRAPGAPRPASVPILVGSHAFSQTTFFSGGRRRGRNIGFLFRFIQGYWSSGQPLPFPRGVFDGPARSGVLRRPIAHFDLDARATLRILMTAH